MEHAGFHGPETRKGSQQAGILAAPTAVVPGRAHAVCVPFPALFDHLGFEPVAADALPRLRFQDSLVGASDSGEELSDAFSVDGTVSEGGKGSRWFTSTQSCTRRLRKAGVRER